MPKHKSKRNRPEPSKLLNLLIIARVIVFAIVNTLFKGGQSVEKNSTIDLVDSPEAQYERALKNNQPTQAFFYSNNCYQCLVMI